MKFNISRVILLNALTKASFGLPKKALNPIFNNFVFEVSENTLTISATDTLTTASVTVDDIDCEDSKFRVVMPAAELMQLAKTAAEGELEFDIAPRKAVITGNKSTWVLNLADASGFPQLPALKNVPWRPVNRQPFIEGLVAVQSAVSYDFGSPGLCMVDVSNNIFRASDRMRLHQMELDHVVPDLSIPTYVVKDFIGVLKTADSEEFKVARGSNGFAALIDNLQLIVGGLSAEFPDVTGMLLKPTLTNDIEVSVDVSDLLAAVRRTRVTADDQTKVLTLKIAENEMQVSTKSAIGSRTTEKIECLSSNTSTVVANLNYSHLEDALKASPLTTVRLFLGKMEGTKAPSVRISATEAGYDAVLSQIRMDLV